jgi:hypothetical protein
MEVTRFQVTVAASTWLAGFLKANPPIATAARAKLKPPPAIANNVFFFISITPVIFVKKNQVFSQP